VNDQQTAILLFLVSASDQLRNGTSPGRTKRYHFAPFGLLAEEVPLLNYIYQRHFTIMVKRSEVHALIDTGSLTEADIPAVLRSVAPEVTALRSMSSKTDPEAVLLDCYDITRLLIRLCALSTSMKTCTSSGKILADIVARMPCSYRCAAMFRDLGAAVSTALRGQKDLQTGGNYTHQIALMDVSANCEYFSSHFCITK
jgi:hypothetical protein